MVYIGVDLHRKKSQVAALDQDGNLVFNRKVRTGPGEMQLLIDELRPKPIQVAFRGDLRLGWFAHLLAELGIPAHMAHPLKTEAVSSARVKDDAVDAKMLAHLLRADLLPEGWIARRRCARLGAWSGCEQLWFGSGPSFGPRFMRCSGARQDSGRASNINPHRFVGSHIYQSQFVYTGSMSKHLVDIDDEALGAARAQLGTETIKDTVNEALRHVGKGRNKEVARSIDVLVRAKLEDRERAWR